MAEDTSAPAAGARPTATGSGAEPPLFEDQASANAAARKRQRLVLYGAVGVGTVIVAAVLLWHPGTPQTEPQSAAVQPGVSGQHPTTMPINTDSMTAASLADSNYRALSENRMDSLENRLKADQSREEKLAQLEQELREIKTGRSSAPVAGSAQGTANSQIAARDAELAALRAEIAELKRNGAKPGAGRAAMPVPGSTTLPPADSVRAGPVAPASGNLLKVDTYGMPAGAKQAEHVGLLFADSPDYLPPNSIATARVIVGADAQASVRSQSEPLPVVLRITSDARSVAQEGHLLKTRVQGCLVNGAAYGDLSSEKVFVKLQKMTCSGAHGGVTVSEVKGFVAFAGKAGVRGRVVSREGSFVVKAFLAGLVGGIGKLGSNVSQSQLYNSYSTNGQIPKLDLGSIAAGAGGSGISAGAGDISKYLIERAEQYQPVVEMPTGVEVEIVFLDGSYVR